MATPKALVTVNFTITKTRGPLRGITIRDQTVSFPSRRSALEWVRGVRANIARGELDYTIDSFTITGGRSAAKNGGRRKKSATGRVRGAMSNPGKPLSNQRDKKSGQYAHGMGAMCECGHSAAHHTYGGGNGCGECIIHEQAYEVASKRSPEGVAWMAAHGDDACDCPKFRKARKAR